MPGLNGIAVAEEIAEDIEEEAVVNVLDVPEGMDDFLGVLEELSLPASTNVEANSLEETVFTVGDSLNKIKTNQEQIDIIRTSLLQIISVIADNPSVFSKWAKSFGDMHIAAKIGTGAAIAVSPAIAALFASIGVIVGTGVTLGAIYTGLALLFEDHNKCAVNTTEKLETGVNAIVDLLAAVIGELSAVSAQLEIGVDNLNKEVGRLNSVVDGLNIMVDTLKTEVGSLKVEVGRLHGELDRLCVVSAEFEERGNELAVINESLDQSALQYQARNLQQAGLINEQKALLKEFELTRLDIQTKLTEVQDEITMRNQANLDIFLSQSQHLNKTAEELEAEKKAHQQTFNRFLHGAKQDFSELNEKLVQSTGELQESQNVRIALQTELTESTEKLSKLEIEYKKTLGELQKQVLILTSHNSDVERGVQAVATSMVKTHHAEQMRQDPGRVAAQAAKRWFGGHGLFGETAQSELPVANATLVSGNESFDL